MVVVIKGEVHNLLSVLRLNARWASEERFVREIPLHAESSVTRDLKALHEYLQEKGEREVDTLLIVSPFVAVLTSNTTGQMTGAALSSLHKFLLYGIVTRESVNGREAINSIAEGIAACRFEDTHRESDEVVLMKLLELTSVSLRCDAGPLIGDSRVAEMFYVCYRVSCQERASELLRSSADNILAHMVLILFRREESEVLVQIMRFLSKLCDPRHNSESTRVLALSLVNIALESGGQRLASQAGLVSTMRGDLCRNLLQNSQSEDNTILSLTLRVIFNLFNSMKNHMKVQLEVFLVSVHLRLLDKEQSALDQRELVLESLLEFCREPVLMLDLYINYDCDVQCTNLFELVCKTLASTAKITETTKTTKTTKKTPVSVLNRLALEGVLGVVSSIARRCCHDDRFPPLVLEEDASDWLAAARERTARVLQQRKRMKKRLALAAEYFNHDQKQWVQRVQQQLGFSTDAASLAKFLRETPGLNKELVGDYLSKPANSEVLKEYASAFDFRASTFDVALRQFLAGFRLPGEAQCIDRLMEVFARGLYAQWSEDDGAPPDSTVPEESGGGHREYANPFKHSDAAFVLAFSTIMLQTDLHNPAIKDEKRMTVEDFLRNNRGINAGEDLPEEFVRSVYEAIKSLPIQQPYDDDELATTPHNWDGLVSRKTAYVSRAAFTPSSATKHFVAGVHERDMFQSIAEPAIEATLAVFERSVDPSLVLKILDGLSNYARICAYFELAKPLNRMLSELLAMPTSYLQDDNLRRRLLEPPPPPAFVSSSSSSSSSKSQQQDLSSSRAAAAAAAAVVVVDQPRELLAFEVALDVVRAHPGITGETFGLVADLFLELADLRAVPPELVEMDDATTDQGARLPPSVFAARCQAHWLYYQSPPPPDPERRGWFSFWWRPASPTSSSSSRREFEGLLRIVSSRMPDLLCRAHSLTAASALVAAILKRADPSISSSEARAALALELAWRVVSSNASRAVALWPLLHARIANVFATSRLSYLAERCAVLALRAPLNLSDPAAANLVRRTLRLLPDLDPDLVSNISDRLALGIAALFRASFEEEEPRPLLKVLARADAPRHVAAALVALLDSSKHFEAAWAASRTLVFSTLDRHFKQDQVVPAVCSVQRLLVGLVHHQTNGDYVDDLRPDILAIFTILSRLQAPPLDKPTEAAILEIVDNTRRLLVQHSILDDDVVDDDQKGGQSDLLLQVV
ncbi:hypothetical protein CTAYLR_008690 [Chrysophaeum taylorii]|uniref:SEC7 domain-containing protein n=1 Tax=Chrysophaeum taylorii TaxID=2483200 RepID=A0AAD7UQY5_9STRA|nr:hypothetical protein CTAYLR_008690 [Chrysophaeum taylorii]